MSKKITYLICAFMLSIGILGAGYSIGKAVYLVKKMNRTVTVKGLAEKDVKSDLGIWEINYREVGNDLVQLDQGIQQDVSLAFDVSSLSPNPSFYYTKLDEIRAGMLAEATKSAYIIAKQFSMDSGSKLAGVQRASQGVFQIMGRDTSTMNADWSSN